MAYRPDWHDHRLAEVLQGVVDGRFPAVDGVIEVVPTDAAGTTAIVEFTGHAFILTDRRPDDPLFVGRDAFGGATAPEVHLGLAHSTTSAACLDVVLCRRGPIAQVEPLRPTTDFDDHPRVRRARQHRGDVTVLGDERGMVCLGQGLVGRLEVSIEAVEPGTGRELLAAGLAVLDDDVAVFAQVSPGNARSLRLFLDGGFVPVGSEIIVAAGTAG